MPYRIAQGTLDHLGVVDHLGRYARIATHRTGYLRILPGNAERLFAEGYFSLQPYGIRTLLFPVFVAGAGMARAYAANAFTTLAGPGAEAGLYTGAGHAPVARGTSGRGGFVIRHVFALGHPSEDLPIPLTPGFRFFVGSWTNHYGYTFGNVNPSTHLNMVGVGIDVNDTSLQVMHNDGTGTATKIALGPMFPVDVANRDLYAVTFWAPPGAAYIGYHIARVGTPHEASGLLETDLPSATEPLGPQLWINSADVNSDYRLLVHDTEYVPWVTL